MVFISRETSARVRFLLEALEPRQLLSGGQLDPSFSGDGVTQLNFGAEVTRMHVVTQGAKTVIVGSVGSSGQLAMARFNTDGSLDTTFGPASTHIVLFDPNGANTDEDFVNAITVDPQGRIYAAVGDFLGFDAQAHGQYAIEHARWRRPERHCV